MMWSSPPPTAQMLPNRMPSNHQIRPKPQQVIYKYVKPSQPIYRPPSARIGFQRPESPDSHSSSTTSTSHSNNESNKCSNKVNNFANVSNVSANLKSALKKSKSFGSRDVSGNQEAIAHLMSIDGVSWENVTLVRRAIEKTNSLTMNQLMQIVRILCNKALEKLSYSRALAIICLTINEKQSETRNHLFIESLLNCLREWFSERDKLRLTSGGARRWTAYVTFISELYLHLKTRTGHRNTKQSYFYGQNDEFDDEYDFTANRDFRQNDSTASLMVDKQQKQFSLLLLDSLQAILLNHNSAPTEIECLQSVLRSCGQSSIDSMVSGGVTDVLVEFIGKYLEEDNASRMKGLMFMIRDAFLSSSAPNLVNCQKLFLEMVELSASRWNFTQSQLIYYFPYTKQIDN